MVVMNRCGQPYLASLLLLCGIRRTLGSLDDDDAGNFGKSFWMNFVVVRSTHAWPGDRRSHTLASQRLSRRTEGDQIEPADGSSHHPTR